MSEKPIFCCTHPRACSTAFERVFMQRKDILSCAHEPFGDAYYFGPERMAGRFANDEKARVDSGYADTTYADIMDEVMASNAHGKRLFIKDMGQYFVPPNKQPASITPSLMHYRTEDSPKFLAIANGLRKPSFNSDGTFLGVSRASNEPLPGSPFATVSEEGNPTIAPRALLEQFHFAFLIRHPRRSVPSYYRCTIPPLSHMTGFHGIRADEMGYDELRAIFDFLRETGQIGPDVTGKDSLQNGHQEESSPSNWPSKPNICIIDADDMLDDPEGIISAFCENVGIKYSPQMLTWEDPNSHEEAKRAFEKWKGFHEDAIKSNDLKPRPRKKRRSDEEVYDEWVKWWGQEAADEIKKIVDANTETYRYLWQYRIRTPALVKRFEEEGY